jgi:hypothetical protein
MLGGNVQDGDRQFSSERNRRPSRCTYQQSTNPFAISIHHTLFRLLSKRLQSHPCQASRRG